MPRISFWTIFILFGIVSSWAEKALRDGKVTLSEAAELAESLGPVLGIPVSIDVPAPSIEPPPQAALDEITVSVEELDPGADIPPPPRKS